MRGRRLRYAGQFRPFLAQDRRQPFFFQRRLRRHIFLRQQLRKLWPQHRHSLIFRLPLLIQQIGNCCIQLFFIQFLRRRFHRTPFQRRMKRSFIILVHFNTKPFTQTSNPGYVAFTKISFATSTNNTSHPPHIGQLPSKNVSEKCHPNKSGVAFLPHLTGNNPDLGTKRVKETSLFPILQSWLRFQRRSRQRFTIGYRRSSQNARLLKRVPGADWNRLYSLI